MAKIRTAAARKYHQTDSESNNSSGDDAAVAKTSKSKPGPKSSKRKSDLDLNSSSETPRRGRGRPPKTAVKSNGRSKNNTADTSEDEAPVSSFVVNSDSDNDAPKAETPRRSRGRPPKTATKSNVRSRISVAYSSEDEAPAPDFAVNSDSENDAPKAKPGPKSKKMALAKEARGRGRPPKSLAKSNGQPKSKRNETSEDEAQASDSNVASDDDVPIKTPKTTKRSSARHSTLPEPSRKNRRSLANDKNDDDKSKNDEASSDDSLKNDDQSNDTPTKSPSKVTKRKADSSTAEQSGSRGPRVHWSKKPKKGDEERYEVEDILDHKVEDGRKYFLIRWKGYGSEVDSWEKQSAISCPAILTKYYEKYPDARLAVKPRNKRKKVVLLPIRPLKIDEQVDYDSDEWNKDEDYEVEKVLDVRFHRDGTREFLIRWKGYSSNSDTWEPEEHLNCEDLIQKFMDKLERIKNVTHKELRPVRAPTKRFTLMAQSDARRLSKRHDGRQRAVYYECDE